MLFNFSRQQISIDLRFEGHESFSKTCRESRNWIFDSDLSSCNLSSISRIEMVQSLSSCKFGNRWEHRESITCQENNIFGMSSVSRNLSVWNKLKRIASSGIFSEMNIREVDVFSLLFKGNILQYCSKFNCIVDLRLFFFAQVHTFGVTSTFHIKNSFISPNMLIISNQSTVSNSAQCGFTSS